MSRLDRVVNALLTGYVMFMCVAVVALIISIPVSIVDNHRWSTWADEHCQVVGARAEERSYTVLVAKMPRTRHYTATITTYDCDDGGVYERAR